MTRDAPVPYRLPRARGTVLGRPAGVVWPVLGVGSGVGALVYGTTSARPGQAVGSYLITCAVVVVCFAVAGLNIRLANRISPAMAMAAAMFSYGATVIVLLIVLASASARYVDGGAVLAGATFTVIAWVAGLVRASWVR